MPEPPITSHPGPSQDPAATSPPRASRYRWGQDAGHPLTVMMALGAGLIYCGGDSAACLMTGQLSALRMLGVALLGATVYSVEIHYYFAWIRSRVLLPQSHPERIVRALLAVAWFNPLWISRHTFFLRGFSGELTDPGMNLLRMGLVSFALTLPISLAANYFIQNRVRPHRRLHASASYSAAMAVYYALMANVLG